MKHRLLIKSQQIWDSWTFLKTTFSLTSFVLPQILFPEISLVRIWTEEDLKEVSSLFCVYEAYAKRIYVYLCHFIFIVPKLMLTFDSSFSNSFWILTFIWENIAVQIFVICYEETLSSQGWSLYINCRINFLRKLCVFLKMELILCKNG